MADKPTKYIHVPEDNPQPQIDTQKVAELEQQLQQKDTLLQQANAEILRLNQLVISPKELRDFHEQLEESKQRKLQLDKRESALSKEQESITRIINEAKLECDKTIKRMAEDCEFRIADNNQDLITRQAELDNQAILIAEYTNLLIEIETSLNNLIAYYNDLLENEQMKIQKEAVLEGYKRMLAEWKKKPAIDRLFERRPPLPENPPIEVTCHYCGMILRL
jgi:hypothetical protein